MKAPMPADVQQTLRRLLAEALVRDYLTEHPAVKPKDGDHPPRDDNPEGGKP